MVAAPPPAGVPQAMASADGAALLPGAVGADPQPQGAQGLRSQSERPQHPTRTRPNRRRTTSFYGLRADGSVQRPSADEEPAPTLQQGNPFRFMNQQSQSAWSLFQELDTNGSGGLDLEEVAQLAQKLQVQMSRREIKQAFAEMDTDRDGDVAFSEFSKWWQEVKEIDRRRVRRLVRDAFVKLDKDHTGCIHKPEFAQMLKGKTRRQLHLLGEPVDLDDDWALLHRKRIETHGEESLTDDLPVTFDDFETWWKTRNGIDDPDIPVLPEYMTKMVNELASFDPSLMVKAAQRRRALQLGGGQPDSTARKTPADHWDFLRPRLKLLVEMEKKWGDLREIYKSHTSSYFEDNPLPKWIRDPESSFSAAWDITQLVFLVYVSFSVPFRACFSVDLEFGSGMFWFDSIVDLYFIVDLVLNFRTSYRKPDGTHEEMPRAIADHYLRGWFIIDFVSCIPVQYIQYAVQGCIEGCTEERNGSSVKALRALRLARMSKMLRLARLKRILLRYRDSFQNLMQYMSMYFLVAMICFSAHMLSCFFYLVGDQWEECNWVSPDTAGNENGPICDENENRLHGWVFMEWGEAVEAGRIPAGTRYLTSMYYIFNALEPHFRTEAELVFAVVAELVMALIYGALAGVISTIMMGTRGNEQESQRKLQSLRTWMHGHKFTKKMQTTVIHYFQQIWSTRAMFDQVQLVDDMPPSMSAEVTTFLYLRFLETIPLFRGLGREVLFKLCHSVTPMLALKGQTLIEEGQPGSEMYLLMSGEVEVSQQHCVLGYLSEGSFFGEIPVLSQDEPEAGVRTRTVKAVTECDLCYVTRAVIRELRDQYPELQARLNRFAQTGAAKRKAAAPKRSTAHPAPTRLPAIRDPPAAALPRTGQPEGKAPGVSAKAVRERVEARLAQAVRKGCFIAQFPMRCSDLRAVAAQEAEVKAAMAAAHERHLASTNTKLAKVMELERRILPAA